MNPLDRHNQRLTNISAEEALRLAFNALWTEVKSSQSSQTNRLATEHNRQSAPPAHNAVRCSDLLAHSVVLEKFEAFNLLQEPHTKRFYLCVDGSELPLLYTDEWATAYRAWFSLRRQQTSVTEDCCSSRLHALVNSHRQHPSFGQLVYSRDRQFYGLLQYSICLSNDLALRWVPSQPQATALGKLVVEPVSRRRHWVAKWIDSPAPHNMVDALHNAIDIFHQRWQYDLYQFNSEHWARLIATGHCDSFQGEELYTYASTTLNLDDASILGMLREHNLEAQTALENALVPRDPSDTLAP
jgi:hypothetical protein